MRFKANKVLRKTAVVLLAAHNQLKIHKHFTGDFARAVAHQRFAKRMYLLGEYRRAIYHSRRARMLAFTVIAENKGTPKREWEFSADENVPPGKKDKPSDADLDNELMKDNPNLTFNDQEWVDKNLDDIDVDEIVNQK